MVSVPDGDGRRRLTLGGYALCAALALASCAPSDPYPPSVFVGLMRTEDGRTHAIAEACGVASAIEVGSGTENWAEAERIYPLDDKTGHIDIDLDDPNVPLKAPESDRSDVAAPLFIRLVSDEGVSAGVFESMPPDGMVAFHTPDAEGNVVGTLEDFWDNASCD